MSSEQTIYTWGVFLHKTTMAGDQEILNLIEKLIFYIFRSSYMIWAVCWLDMIIGLSFISKKSTYLVFQHY